MVRPGSPCPTTPVRHVDDAERRARLARRHAIAPAHRVATYEDAVASVVCLHATEPPTVFLSGIARVEGLDHAAVTTALYEERTVVKQLAMRRTLWGFPRELLPAALGGPSARVAEQQRRQLVRDLERSAFCADGGAWVAEAETELLAALAAGPATTQELRAHSPLLGATMPMAMDKPYGGHQPLAPRLLTVLGAEGRVVRGRHDGSWRTSRPRWARSGEWLGGPVEPLGAEAAYVELVRRWLAAFGPGTEDDLVWWFGATKSAVRRALADLAAVTVGLDGGGVGWVLPDDVEPEPAVEPWAALLPVLDPTTMGWKERGFYLGTHRPMVFDVNGNAGTTAWWQGRVVGGWYQHPDGQVAVALLEDIGADGVAALEIEAARLGDWLAGERVGTVYPSPLMRQHTTTS